MVKSVEIRLTSAPFAYNSHHEKAPVRLLALVNIPRPSACLKRVGKVRIFSGADTPQKGSSDPTQLSPLANVLFA